MIKKFISTRRLQPDENGSTLVEFAIVLPTFLLLMLGTFDLGYSAYVRTVLSGAIQQAARDSALESAALASGTVPIDALIRERIGHLGISGTDSDGEQRIKIERLSYFTFDDVNRPEQFTDAPGGVDGVCDNGEIFSDENGNAIWDDDVGEVGLGGARDVVQYRVTATYDRIFPLYRIIGGSQEGTVSATTILQNQPYNVQDTSVMIDSGICS